MSQKLNSKIKTAFRTIIFATMLSLPLANCANRGDIILPTLPSLATLATLPTLPTLASANNIESNAYADIIFDLNKNIVLAQTAANTPRYPASLAKLMTLYLLFADLEKKKIHFNEQILISSKAAKQPRSRLGMLEGDRISVRNAISALIVHSANDVAVAVGEHLAGSETAFVKKMNFQAKKLNMKNTYFKNSTGLHHYKQTTTATDMVLLAIALRRDFPDYYSFFKEINFAYNGRIYHNRNKLLKKIDGATGLKTGFTLKSGYHLLTTFEDDKKNIVAIVMGEQTPLSRDQRMLNLINSFVK